MCVSAPTGSVKTLAYVLPVIEALPSRIITHLRALVVLPTRDLVTQVKETFEAVGKGCGLKIGTVTGQRSFSREQAQLIENISISMRGGSSKLDILICTPGRLMDHLNGTPNFALQHLRIPGEKLRQLKENFSERAFSSGDRRGGSLTGAFLPGLDPGRLASLDPRNPKYFIIQSRAEGGDKSAALDVIFEKFAIPATLSEHMVICDLYLKPLILLHFFYDLSIHGVLVFTKSSESASRLV
ncbi:P-loop containing nucleoside triphosphate hydrolase protein [Pisolithus orientalis]|uniref:P-loop containing nucleoside triphosphate hydrolase protein n=1 Tax=Pisolithus orientalis TaxID=936130 RepID=UPI002225865F|nr:P-loop containing nucleoside triphosphate hydrolase protein [Pisolithus orientalis]KAI6025587.1 P-loop containing nucleoside triphosphate hydrolase protein [Pisolithus orientalis]